LEYISNSRSALLHSLTSREIIVTHFTNILGFIAVSLTFQSARASMQCVYRMIQRSGGEPTLVAQEIKGRNAQRVAYLIDPFGEFEIGIGKGDDENLFGVVHVFSKKRGRPRKPTVVNIENLHRKTKDVPRTSDEPLGIVAKIESDEAQPFRFKLIYGVQNHLHAGASFIPGSEIRGTRFDGRLSFSGDGLRPINNRNVPVVESYGQEFLWRLIDP